MLNNTYTHYGKVSRYLHWIMALLIIGMLAVGYTMKYYLQPSDLKWQLYDLHKATGTLLVALIAIRIYWRLTHIVPQLQKNNPLWEQISAALNIRVLYLLMVMMPLSGLGMSLFGGHNINIFNLFTIKSIANNSAISTYFNLMHFIIAVLFCVTIFLHICGAMYGYFIEKDGVLKNMLWGK